jgi:heat shock protein HspQ
MSGEGTWLLQPWYPAMSRMTLRPAPFLHLLAELPTAAGATVAERWIGRSHDERIRQPDSLTVAADRDALKRLEVHG